jgi:hypothetical protein
MIITALNINFKQKYIGLTERLIRVIYVERVTIGMCSLKIYIYELTNRLKQSFVFTYCTVSKTTANIHTHVNNPRVTHA